jgi:hypothetical protein
VVAFLIALVPSAGALFIFWLVLRGLLQADRRERAAMAQYEAAEDRAAAEGAATERAERTGTERSAVQPTTAPGATTDSEGRGGNET